MQFEQSVGPTHSDEEVLDVLRQRVVERRSQGHFIVSGQGRPFVKFDDELIDTVSVIHFDGGKGSLSSVWSITVSEHSIKFEDKGIPACDDRGRGDLYQKVVEPLRRRPSQE